MSEMRLVPVSFDDACKFVEAWHRHNQPPIGHKFSVGVANDGVLVGVAMIGRPVARSYDPLPLGGVMTPAAAPTSAYRRAREESKR